MSNSHYDFGQSLLFVVIASQADNPIYVSPTQDYRNVTYRKQPTTIQPSATNMLFVSAPPLDTMDTY